MTDISLDTHAAIKALVDGLQEHGFIAAARTDVPTLLAAYEAVAAERDTLKATLDKVAALSEWWLGQADMKTDPVLANLVHELRETLGVQP